MLKFMRILFVIAASIELIAIFAWIFGERTSLLNLVFIVSSMVLLQVTLLVNSKFKLWKRP